MRFVLRRKLGHHTVGRDGKPPGGKYALQHHFRGVLEGIGYHAVLSDGDAVTISLDLKAPIVAARLPCDLLGEAMQLQAFSVPLLGLRHDLVHMFVVFGGVAHGGVEEAAERDREYQGCESDFERFVLHM